MSAHPTRLCNQRQVAAAVWTGQAAVLVAGLDFRRQAPHADGVEWTPSVEVTSRDTAMADWCRRLPGA